jgi:anti-sigma B factor antagonist
MSAETRMEIEEVERDGVKIAAVRGRVDGSNAESLERRLLGLLDAGGGRLVLDLTGVDYVNSAGLRAVLIAAKRSIAVGGTLAVVAVHGVVREVLDMAGFSAILPMFEQTDTAVAAVR